MCKCLFGVFSKTFLIVLNVIFALGGAFMLIIGSIAQSNTKLLLNFLRIIPPVQSFIMAMETNGSIDLINNMAIGLITMGGILFIFGVAGCCGASCSCTLCLVPYAIFLIILIACQIGIIVFAALDPAMFKSRVEESMYKNIYFYEGTGMNYNPTNRSLQFGNTAWTASWDYMQVGAKCCGSRGVADWKTGNTTHWTPTYYICDPNAPATPCTTFNNAIVPLSCCKVNDPDYYPESMGSLMVLDAETCLRSASEETTNQKGCYESVQDVVVQYSTVVIAVTATLMGIQILAVICACFLSRAK